MKTFIKFFSIFTFMFKIEKIQELLRKRPKKEDMPKHVVLDTYGTIRWSETNKKTLEEAYKKKLQNIIDIIKLQVEKDIPILTIQLLSKEKAIENVDILVEFFRALKSSHLINENKIKVFVLGKWYDLPGEIVEPIKSIIEETNDYDNFFVNFCINYDGQEEIIDSCKLIARKIKEDKIKMEEIDKKEFKDNLYSSHFIPPELIIDNRPKLMGLLLWDTKNAKIVRIKKLFPDFTQKDFLKALELYREKE